MLEEPSATYYYDLNRRRSLAAVWMVLASFPGMTSLLVGIYRLREPVPGDERSVVVFFVVFGACVLAFCLLALVAVPRAGRLMFLSDRAELPRACPALVLPQPSPLHIQ